MTRLVQMSGVVVDAVYRVAAVPAPGAEALVRGLTLTAGGGMNAMVAARRAGLAVAWGGTLGTGPLADLVAAALAAQGIAVLRPRLPGQDQGLCTVLVDDRGERTFIAAEGADGQMSPADLDRMAILPGDWLLLSGYALYYPGSQVALTSWLAGHPPGRLVFDPAPIVDRLPGAVVESALRAAAWVSANRSEAAHLTGSADPARAARLLARGRSGALVRDGAAGAWLAQGDGVAHIAPHRVTAVDTNGAGDCHIGTFIAALARGEPAQRAARIANIAAALSTLRHGPDTAPNHAEVLDIMKNSQEMTP